MNKSFNHFIKNAFLASLGILILSALLIFSYMESKGLSFDQLFNEGNFYFTSNIKANNPLNLTGHITTSKSDYDLLLLYEDNVFEPVEDITINTSIEDIIFIHEVREDIRVVFEREVPNTKSYDVTYKTRATNNHLSIDVNLNSTGFYADQDYEGSLTLYLPMDYECDHLTINSTISSHEISLPKSVNDVNIDVNFGSLTVTSPYSLESLRLSVNAGDLNFTTQAPIDKVIANVDTGELNFEIMADVDDLRASNNIGSIKGYIYQSPEDMEVSSNLGDIMLEFEMPVNKLKASLDVGDIDIDVANDDDSQVYIDTDLVEYSSHLSSTSNRSSADIIVEMNLGETNIH